MFFSVKLPYLTQFEFFTTVSVHITMQFKKLNIHKNKHDCYTKGFGIPGPLAETPPESPPRPSPQSSHKKSSSSSPSNIMTNRPLVRLDGVQNLSQTDRLSQELKPKRDSSLSSTPVQDPSYKSPKRSFLFSQISSDGHDETDFSTNHK